MAFDGREAIRPSKRPLRKKSLYKLLFLDIMMPEVNSIDVLKPSGR